MVSPEFIIGGLPDGWIFDTDATGTEVIREVKVGTDGSINFTGRKLVFESNRLSNGQMRHPEIKSEYYWKVSKQNAGDPIRIGVNM